MHMMYSLSVRSGLWLQTRLLFSNTRNTLDRAYTRLFIECVKDEAWLTIVNIMVQIQGYICYTLFKILCIITHNTIIINYHNKIKA